LKWKQSAEMEVSNLNELRAERQTKSLLAGRVRSRAKEPVKKPPEELIFLGVSKETRN